MKINIKITFLYIIYIVWLFGYANAQVCNNASWINCNTPTQLQVRLYNSYSWQINYYSGNWWQFSSWWNIYVSHLQNQVLVSATDSSIYNMSWDLSTWSIWAGSGNYTNLQNVNFTSWDWDKFLQANFLKVAEFYYSNTLKFILDQTPPNKPVISWPSIWSTQTSNIHFDWSDSYDTWVWFSWYYIYFSLNPNWPYTKIWIWNNSQFDISSDLLPSGTMYRYVTAVDYLWNTSDPVYWFFHNKFPTILNGESYNPSQINTHSDLYPENQEKNHFVADVKDIESWDCNIHWYDDFADCKATLDDKYILKNKLYENYFETKWALEEKWLLPLALPNSWVDASGDDITVNNEDYKKLLPHDTQNSNWLVCENIYMYQAFIAWLIVVILCIYIVYDKNNKYNKNWDN